MVRQWLSITGVQDEGLISDALWALWFIHGKKWQAPHIICMVSSRDGKTGDDYQSINQSINQSIKFYFRLRAHKHSIE
jgi:hypothetical protein